MLEPVVRLSIRRRMLVRIVTTLAAWSIAFVIVLVLLLLFGRTLESFPPALNALVFTGVLVPLMGTLVMPFLAAVVSRLIANPAAAPILGAVLATSSRAALRPTSFEDRVPLGELRPDPPGGVVIHGSRGFHSVTPRMVVSDVAVAVDFLRAVFHATGELHVDRPTEIRIGDSLVMVTPADERDLFPAFLYVYVDDTDSAYRRAVAAGAESLEEPSDSPYGDRRAMVRDPFNNVFQIAHRREPSAL